MGQHPGESTTKTKSNLNTVDEETFMMTKTQEPREKRALRMPASISISQTETPTAAQKTLAKKSASIADIYQEPFQLKFPNSNKFKERNKSNSVLPTTQ